jgi:5-methylcytosine-specific restriction protein A
MSGRVYDRRHWRRVRAHKLSVSPLCEDCREVGIITPACHVDHIRSIRDGGAIYDLANLRANCASCHSRKTASQDRGFGNVPGERKVPGCDRNGLPLDPAHPWRDPDDENHGMPAADNRVRSSGQS